MKKIIIILIALCYFSPSQATEPIQFKDFSQDSHQINLRLPARDGKSAKRGVTMMVTGAACIVGGVAMDYQFKEHGVYRSENYPYNQWAGTGSAALSAVGLLLFLGGLNNFVKVF